jgi:hypothetical protein
MLYRDSIPFFIYSTRHAMVQKNESSKEQRPKGSKNGPKAHFKSAKNI